MSSERRYRKLKICALTVAVYAVSSGPVGGFVTLLNEHPPFGSQDLAWKIYFGHAIVYAPILYAAKFTGASPVVFGYWELCGWRWGVPF